ncbi:MAG: SMP-30/gluconolactonase/LRE family protein, partial [Rhodoferax sp.]|nr:SMP-30/gluconolactonase/LRE family protein [Rhodoferax sp.]
MKSSNSPWNTVSTQTFALGESPFWHPQEQTLYWVDIAGMKLAHANVYVGSVETWDMPSEPGCIAPAASGGLVIALRDGVFRARNWGGALEWIATLDYDPKTVRANDGKCDPLGRFWVGTVDEPKAANAGTLYSVDCRAGGPVVTRQAGDALTANGLAWSPDVGTLYWADTPNHVVHAWNFDLEANALSAHRNFLQLPGKPAGWQCTDTSYQGRPDGAAVDALGNYWVAMYEGRRICVFSPAGELLRDIETPVQCPTMPCFGGEDLRT